MKINYKEPYWLKFNWDISNHHENQYVTNFDKIENKKFNDFLHEDSYIITCNFSIKESYKKDKISMVFGKPGKNFGLSFNNETKILALEFWVAYPSVDKLVFLQSNTIKLEDIEKGVTVSIVRDKNRFTIYKNFEFDNSTTFVNNLIEDYKETGLFIGCSSPECGVKNNRYHLELDINHFSIIMNNSNVEVAKEIYDIDTNNLVRVNHYKDILCYYDFKTINNLGIVYDESINSNFLEKVPIQYIK
jgi:hypothetical protein